MRVKASDSHTWISVQVADESIGEKIGSLSMAGPSKL